MFWGLLIVIFLIWTLFQRWKIRKFINLYHQLKPKSVCLPFIGHAYLVRGSSEDRMNAFRKIGEESYKTGGLISHWLGNTLYIGVADPLAAESILKNCLEKDDLVKLFRAVIGNGSIFATVPIWRPRRKMLAPTFSAKNLNQFVRIFAEQSHIMVNRLREATEVLSIWNYFTKYTMDTVCETTLGIKMQSQLQPEQPFLRAFETTSRLDMQRICQPWLHNDTVYRCLPAYKQQSQAKKILHDFITEIIQSKKKSMEMDENMHCTNPGDGLKTFLELLVEASKNSLSDLELREETLVIVLAGTDTSAVGTSFTALMLSMHPDVQDKCYEELREVFGESDRPVAAEDLPRLKYLDAVIRETLRLYPPVPIIVRKVEKDIILPSGITLVEGCGVIISIFAIHRNPEYWGEDAEQYRPERFLDSELKHPAAFMPFSHGPRACLGYKYAMMSMKTALATLLRHYRLLPAPGNTVEDPLRLEMSIMMRHVDKFQVVLQTRDTRKC